jgi:hypothetical protein
MTDSTAVVEKPAAGPPSSSRPVFLSRDGRRWRAATLAGCALAALALLWVIALVAGALGVSAPGILRLPGVKAQSAAHDASAGTSGRPHGTVRGRRAAAFQAGARPATRPRSTRSGSSAVPVPNHGGTTSGRVSAPAHPGRRAPESVTPQPATSSTTSTVGATKVVPSQKTHPANRGGSVSTASHAKQSASSTVTGPSKTASGNSASAPGAAVRVLHGHGG